MMDGAGWDNELHMKKRMLRLRSATLRQQLGVQFLEGVAPALSVADGFLAGGRWLRQHPAWLIVPAVAMFVWRARRDAGVGTSTVRRWFSRGVWLWQTWKRLQPWLHLLRPQTGREAEAAPHHAGR